ncbi:hypothetical protein BT63DRAFT_426469 [Microthyrium microscopicum]|uniref:J domain-containing protein n=1 Tax=Microthyrium microscopicum TaxID=703497 RepID=A0A6A6U5R4_9PEZI|nr:hypothetical protein BT63DRAFT_426469 [Microthyrium microscopicum]
MPPSPKEPPKEPPKDNPTDSVPDTDILDALEKESKEFDKDAEIDRILNSFKLDAYAVLDLQPGVPPSSIKATYRKKSLLIHPDKTSNPRAPDAFDRLAKAHTELLDDKHRERLDESIADARMLLLREKKWTVDTPEFREAQDTEEWRRLWRDKTRMVLVDDELRRRKQMKAQMQEEGREQRKVDEEIEERKRKREHEVKWEATREQRIGSWRDFQKGKGGDEGKKKKKKLKVLG